MSQTKKTQLAQALPLLLDWFSLEGRDLAFRHGRTPYRVLLAEFLLQQTQMNAAEPYFLRFIQRWPTLEDLAAAPDEEVRAAFAGLGYYRRASNLLACVRAIVRDHQGQVPDMEKDLRALPGIGPYTAAAIASIAFGRRAAAIDGNLLRVLSRLQMAPYTAGEASSQKKAKEALEAAMAEQESLPAAAINEAFMDLSTRFCHPQAPLCLECPLHSVCLASQADRSEEFPEKKTLPPKKEENRSYLLLFAGNSLYLRKRSESLLQHTYEPILCALNASIGELPLPLLQVAETAALPYFPAPIRVGKVEDLGQVDHVFSHRIWHCHFYLAQQAPVADAANPYPGSLEVAGKEYRLYPRADWQKLPFSSLFSKILKRL